MRPGVAVALLLACAAAAPRAAADECQMGWALSHDVPRDGAIVRPNARFRVLEHWGCSSVDGGPRHQLRLLDAAGAEIPFDPLPYTRHYLELTPEVPLSPGAVTLQVRRPLTKDTLGPWEPLSRVTVAGSPDTSPPTFEGILSGEARAVEGTVALSPCEVVPGWELETRLRFRAAADAGSHHDELLYRLERSAQGSDPWEEVTTLRPSPEGDHMAFQWKSESGWSETWTYRMSVRDMAGHETTGARRVILRNPARPARELWSPASDPRLPTPGPGSCRCAIAGSPLRGPAPAAAFMVLAAAGYERRRRRRASSSASRPARAPAR